MHYDLTEQLLEKPQPGKIGRYSVSKLWGCINTNREGEPYCTPKQYLEGEAIDVHQALRMKMGTLKHEFVQSLLPDWEHERKVEYQYDDFTIVGKIDCIKDKKGLEIKTTTEIMDTAKPWAVWQARMYASMFNLESIQVVQPVIEEGKFILKVLRTSKQNQEWFEKQLLLIKQFHLCLKKSSQTV